MSDDRRTPAAWHSNATTLKTTLRSADDVGELGNVRVTIGRIVSESVRTDVIENPAQHRLTVIRRLLDAGLSPTTLVSVLPEFRDVIHDIVVDDAHEDHSLVAAS
jgi:hypothetical protein